MKLVPHCKVFLLVVAISVFSAGAEQARSAPTATTTKLAITSGGNAVASGGSVASGSEVTLTATVVAGSTSLTIGQVSFCDASATYCTDIHLLGVAQLTNAGKAVLRLHPGVGSHSYKCAFVGVPNGTPAYAASTSPTVTLTVSGTFPTATAIAATGSAGNYSLTATVTANTNAGALPAPTGAVSFLDATNTYSSLGTASLGMGTESLNFLNSSNPSLGDLAWAAVVGDLNGDGIPDIAVANYGDGTVAILLGKGDGTFTPAAGSPVTGGSTPFSIAIADFNGDGIPDLVTANYYASSLSILLGSGDGTFTEAPHSPLTVGAVPDVAAVGDFNGDGIPDIVVANAIGGSSGPGSITVLLGKGDGTFTPTANSPVTVGTGPISIAVGDFNGDDIPDLAIANNGDATVWIMLGKGDGTFAQAPKSPVTVGYWPWSVVAGDFNGDGRIDLAVANEYATANLDPNTSVTILLGNGNGTFTQASGSPVTVGSEPEYVNVGDFNGDGIPDLATANNGDGTASVLLGNGDGTFSQAANSPLRAGDSPQSIAVGSFDEGGISDLAAVSGGAGGLKVWISQLTQASTAFATGISPTGTGTHQVEASYPGDSLYNPSISATIALTAVAPPSFSITGTAVTLTAGATTGNTSTITITPSGAFTGSVALTAALTSSPANAVHPPIVSFGATTPISITGASDGTATLTITTMASSSPPCTSENWMLRPFSGYFGGGAVLACLFICGIPRRSRNWRSIFGMLFLLGGFMAGTVACGGGGTKACTSIPTPGTTAGTYTVTITGASASLTETGTVTLTVQ